jgi:hypothetical protein
MATPPTKEILAMFVLRVKTPMATPLTKKINF